MANEELNPKYVVSTWEGLIQLQTDVNKLIQKWYVPYGPMMVDWYTFMQVLIDPLVLERQQVTIRKWVVTATSTVTIPGTVNVSWCW